MTRAQIFGSGVALLLLCLGLVPLLSPYLNPSGYIPLTDSIYPGIVVYAENNEQFKPVFTIIASNQAGNTVLIELPNGKRETRDRTSLTRNRNLYVWSDDPALKVKQGKTID
jgi:hypothetical protein